MTRQAGLVSHQAVLVALDWIDRVPRSSHYTELGARPMWLGDGPDRMRCSHHNDGGSIFSREVAIEANSGNTVNGARVALGH